MAFQSGSINPTSTSPASDITKITNDLAVLRSVLGGGTDSDVPFRLPQTVPDASGVNTLFLSGGNLGVGAAPSSWGGSYTAIQNRAVSLSSVSGIIGFLAANCYQDGTVWRYTSGGAATRYDFNNANEHRWFSAPVGSAGAAATFTQAMTLDANGNLLVGQTSAGQVNSTSVCLGVTTGGIDLNHATGVASGIMFARFNLAGTGIGSITQNGTTGVTYNTSSDYRLKTITGPLTGSGEFIDALKPCQGSWKADGSRFVGFLAHEFQAVSPSSVTGEKDAVDEDGKPIYQAMQASSPEVMANIIAELQSLRARVAALEAAQ